MCVRAQYIALASKVLTMCQENLWASEEIRSICWLQKPQYTYLEAIPEDRKTVYERSAQGDIKVDINL